MSLLISATRGRKPRSIPSDSPLDPGLDPEYLYLRMVIEASNQSEGYSMLAELAFFDKEDAYILSGASLSASRTADGSVYDLIDGDVGTAWGSGNGGEVTIAMDLAALATVSSYAVTPYLKAYAPKQWRIEASSDGESFSVIATESDQVNWTNQQARYFEIAT